MIFRRVCVMSKGLFGAQNMFGISEFVPLLELKPMTHMRHFSFTWVPKCSVAEQ